MALQYRKITKNDLTVFIQMRINQLQEEGAEAILDLAPYLMEYYVRHLDDHRFISWLALDGDNIVGTSGLSLVEKPPYYRCPSGKIGLLSSMYVVKEYRRKGIAKTLLHMIIEEAKDDGCSMVQITASDQGVLLYTDFGFEKNNNFMCYHLEE